MTQNRSGQKTADEIYEVVAICEGNPVGGIVTVRFNPDDMRLLTTTGDRLGLTMSETLRMALRRLAAEPDAPDQSREAEARVASQLQESALEVEPEPMKGWRRSA